MRLIDADYMKKAIEQFFVREKYYNPRSRLKSIPKDEALDIIDSAPTVEPFEPDYVGAERLKARQRGYEEGYHNGMEIGKTLNPKIKQGEWILNKDGNPECPFCHHSFTYWGNFCGNCGADMRGDNDDG